MKKSKRRKLLYCVAAIVLVLIAVILGTGQYFKSQWLRDTPNNLTIEGDEHVIPFSWTNQKYGTVTETKDGMLVPVTVPGTTKTLYMQFDTGAADTFVRSEAISLLRERGAGYELFERDDRVYARAFEFQIGDAKVIVKDAHLPGRHAAIDWDDPDSVNIIGTIGADLIDQRICEIDFPAQEIRLFNSRPKHLDQLGEFVPFEFQGRRIILPVKLNGTDEKVHWDSGCSAFGLLTSAYFYDQLTDTDAAEISYNANRHGDRVPVYHRASDMPIQFGSTEVPVNRISYVKLYEQAQFAFGRFSGLAGFIGFLGNRSFDGCTLILDAKARQYLVVKNQSDEG